MWEWVKGKFYKIGSEFDTTNEMTYTSTSTDTSTWGGNQLYYQQLVNQTRNQMKHYQNLQQQYITSTTAAIGPGSPFYRSPFYMDPMVGKREELHKVHAAAKAYAYERILYA